MRSLSVSPALLISVASAQTLLTPELDKFIENTLTSWGGYSGAGVAVVKLNNASWEVDTKGYGVRGDGQKVDANTLFGIGSNSKLFTAVAAGLLVADETVTPRISFDTKVADIFPGFELMDPIASKETTIIDLASHRSGLATHDFMYSAEDNVSSIMSRLKDLKPGARFRESFQYSNIGYGILGYLPEVLSTKTKIAPFIKKRIFDALNMTSSTFSYDVAVKNNNGNVASGVGRDNLGLDLSKATPRKLPFWAKDPEEGSYLSSAGGIISNAKEMAVWLQTLMRDGKHPATGAVVIPPKIFQAIKAPNMVADEFSFGAQFNDPEIMNMFSPVAYGAGQFTQSYRGHTVIGHSGDVPGFHSVLCRLPYDNLGVVVLTNDHEFGAKIAEIIKLRILDTHLGLPPFDFNTATQKTLMASLTAPKPQRSANASLPTIGSIESFEGQYTAPGYGTTLNVCAFVPNGTVSDECQNKFDKLQTIVDTKTPTLTAEVNGILASHLILKHWGGDVWNVSAASVQPTGDSKKPFWAAPTSGGAWTAEFTKDEEGKVGFALRGGFWGRGSLREPTGDTVKERAEVYWTKRD